MTEKTGVIGGLDLPEKAERSREIGPHSTILASCKSGRKPGRKQVESMSKASCELAQRRAKS